VKKEDAGRSGARVAGRVEGEGISSLVGVVGEEEVQV